VPGIPVQSLTVTPVGWVATGNFTNDNITTIHGWINSNFVSLGTSTTNTAFAKNFSDYLNSVWDQAWNVVVI
jgi:hypothetical protein